MDDTCITSIDNGSDTLATASCFSKAAAFNFIDNVPAQKDHDYVNVLNDSVLSSIKKDLFSVKIAQKRFVVFLVKKHWQQHLKVIHI